MAGLLKTRTDASSPFASRAVQSRFISLEEAEQDAIQVYAGSLTRQTLACVLVALLFLSIMGYSALNNGAVAVAEEFQAAGTAVLCICIAVLAYVVYEYRRKRRVFVLEDSFAVERRYRFDVELVRWTDVARLYLLDRTTETKVSVYFIPVTTTKVHRGKLRIVLVDGRKIIITNRVRDFSAMAAQFALRTMAAQLGPSIAFLIDGGTLDFDTFGLSSKGLVYKRKLVGWNDVDRISLNRRGTLLFKTAKQWWSPRFSTDKLPNAALLLELLAKFGGVVYGA
jgi:Family of unknown function (DUF6585)